MSQYKLGLEGEDLAEAYLRKQGFDILQRRLRGRHGEVDLLARKRGVLYFVEVKYRPEGRLGDGMQVITPRKKKLLLNVIREYLAQQPQAWRLAYLEISRAGVRMVEDVMQEH